MSTIQLGVLMDPINAIHFKKDSTLAMLWEAQARGWIIHYFEQKDLYIKNGLPYGDTKILEVFQDANQWYRFTHQKDIALNELDVILMRKDPPFNEEYIYTTHLLERAESLGVLVVNKPRSLRDYNEKLFTTYFPQCAPPSLVTRSIEKLRAFWEEYSDIVCKPLDSMGGVSVFRLKEDDQNAPVVFEILTQKETRYIMAQQFIPAIKQGDKRILLINGEPILHALARVPQENDWRGNLAVGAKGVVQPLSERDLFICTQVGPMLREKGLYFVGLDVIGEYLTEINITSPTGIRELDLALRVNISASLMDVIEEKIAPTSLS